MVDGGRIRRMSHHIHQQVHDKFKIFSGVLASDGTIGKLADEVADFVTASRIAPKSIGVAYLPSKHLVITLGYRDDDQPYPIKLHCIPLGKVDVKGGDFRALERKIGEASSKYRNIICHEIYVMGENDFTVVVMTHEVA
jgi:hypothetical protein